MSATLAVYFNSKIIIKILRQHTLSFYMNVNFSKRIKTHYETLEISPNATHNEIKSSYYKLTLKYHPDKNESDSAKQKFQEISNAYEVLSHYKSRKQYDRTIAIKSGNVSAHNIVKPKMTYEHETWSQRGKIYDFDEWTRAHYKYTFEKTQIRKNIYNEYQAQQESKIEKTRRRVTSYIIPSICILIWIFSYAIDIKHNDSVKDNKSDSEL